MPISNTETLSVAVPYVVHGPLIDRKLPPKLSTVMPVAPISKGVPLVSVVVFTVQV